MKRLLSLGTTLLLALVLAASCGGDADHNAQDVTFASDMIPHHEQAVTMSDLALAQAASPQVKDLATRIKAAQGPEISTMQGWLASWGEKEGAGGHDGHTMGSGQGMPGSASMQGMLGDEELGRLRSATGPEFDRLFLEGMIAHHNGAVTMARTEVDKGRFQPARDLASKIIADQEREIAEMTQLLTTVAA